MGKGAGFKALRTQNRLTYPPPPNLGSERLPYQGRHPFASENAKGHSMTNPCREANMARVAFLLVIVLSLGHARRHRYENTGSLKIWQI